MWNSIPLACCSFVFTATKRIVGRCAAVADRLCIRHVVLMPLHERLDVDRGSNLTSWPSSPSRGPSGERPRKPPSRPRSAAEKCSRKSAVSRLPAQLPVGTRQSRSPYPAHEAAKARPSPGKSIFRHDAVTCSTEPSSFRGRTTTTPRAGRRQPREGASPRARVPPMDYADKLPPSPWYIFAPPRRYIFPPPLTRGCEKVGGQVRANGQMRRDRENQLLDRSSQARVPDLDPFRVSPYRPAASNRSHQQAE